MPTFDTGSTVVTDRFVLFWQPPSPFSQWTYSEFVVDGVPYTHAEQFMMAEKARLFGDTAILAQILGAQDPRTQKALGRQVHDFSEAPWLAQRSEIVVRGNLAKFSQDPLLREALLDTGDRILVEASPLDRVWGIGLRADDRRALDPSRWRGLNLLGEALVEVRRRLRDQGHSCPDS